MSLGHNSLKVSAHAQGNAAGYVQAAMPGEFVIGPLAGTLIYPLTPAAPLWLALACCLVCYMVFLLVAKSPSGPTQAPSTEVSEAVK